MNNIQNMYFTQHISSAERYNAVKSLAMLDKANKKAQLMLKYSNKMNQTNDNAPISRFKETLSLMDKTSAMIIEKEFDEYNTDKFWYDKYFSKTTYYKNRKKAIEEFLYFYLN